MTTTVPTNKKCSDDTQLTPKLQIMLDSGNRYFDRIEAATTSLETKAQHTLEITLAIISVALPIYFSLSEGGPRNGVWLVQGLLVALAGSITIVFSVVVSKTRVVYVPNTNSDLAFFSGLIDKFRDEPECEQLVQELIQLWGNESRKSNKHGAVGHAIAINRYKRFYMGGVSRSFAAFMTTIFVGSLFSAFMSMG